MVRETIYGKGDDNLEARIQAIRADFDYEQAQTFGLSEGFEHDYTVSGGDFNVVLMTDYPEAAVIRVPRLDTKFWSDTWYEYACTEVLSVKARQCPPPLRLPVTINEWDLADVPYCAIEKLPGRAMISHEMSTLSEPELRRYGQKIGEFVAWMELMVTGDDRDEAIANSRYPVHANRIDYVQFLLTNDSVRQDMLKLGHAPLVTALEEIEAQARDYNKAGLFKPSSLGHGDLSSGNILLERNDGQWQPSAVIDNSIKPTNPESELRYVWAMGGAAAEAAIQSYESSTGKTLDTELLDFWAMAQTLTNCAFVIMAPGYSLEGLPRLPQLFKQLRQLMPHIDWQSEKYTLPAPFQSVETGRMICFTPDGNPAGDRVGFELVRL